MARPGAGAVLTRREVEGSGDVQGAWDAWAAHHPREAASAWEQAEGQWRILQDLGGQVVTFHDLRYPGLLAQISDAPPVLYALGAWPKASDWGRALAVVGTRSCTPQGAAWARQAGREWTECGGWLVSGLARGIDGRAHEGAMQSQHPGRQVAVLPCSLDQIHPAIHRDLARDIVEAGGLLLTEQPPGVSVERWMFASRNRILTGLAPTTVVVQSPARGGSLISAKCAFESNRAVYTLWQRGMGVGWAGNRALVADHIAAPVRDVDALWAAMSADARRQVRATTKRHDRVAETAFPEGCRRVWDAIHHKHPTPWRVLQKKTNLCVAELDRKLFTLELQGWIRRLPGRAYLRH